MAQAIHFVIDVLDNTEQFRVSVTVLLPEAVYKSGIKLLFSVNYFSLLGRNIGPEVSRLGYPLSPGRWYEGYRSIKGTRVLIL